MRLWVTEFKALCAKTGVLKTYGGPDVEGLTHGIAQQWCYDNAGHLNVIGELVAEIPCKEGTYEPDFNKMIDYELKNN